LDVKQKVDGVQLLKQLRQHEETSEIEVVMISAYDDAEVRRACEAEGVHFLRKPVTTQVVLELALKAGNAQRRKIKRAPTANA
jgi:CheY-like chemotaxis protein